MLCIAEFFTVSTQLYSLYQRICIAEVFTVSTQLYSPYQRLCIAEVFTVSTQLLSMVWLLNLFNVITCCRHHTNPVGTEWKWKMDDPQTILDGALTNHINLIRQFRGTCDFVLLFVCCLDCQYKCNWMPGKTHPHNDLLPQIPHWFTAPP